MKNPLFIHWFSPVPHARTGIAEVTGILLPALAKHARVTLWTSQAEWSRELEEHALVKHFDGETTALPNGPRDICFYNLGNNGTHHADILKASVRQRGIVIIHDVCLQGLRTATTAKEYLEKVGEPPPVSGETMFEGLGIERARGAVVHTSAGYNALVRVGLPTVQANLPYLPATNSPPPEEISCSFPSARRALARIRHSRNKAGRREKRSLTIFGFLAWNRRLGSIIQALSCMPEREQFQLDIFGEVYEAHLRPLARAAGLRESVTFHGFVPDAVLDRALSQTDLAVNLRYPTMGESSLSQLRIWAHSVPSVVTRDGWYGELDDGVVDFVRTEYEIEDLQSAFRRLLVAPGHFVAQGLRGHQRLITLHDPERYARELVEFAERLLGNATLGESA